MILLRPKEDLAVVISSVAILGVCHEDDGDDDEHDDDLKSPGTCERRPSLDIQRTTALTISLRQAGIPFT